jgi:hypothetical protein
VTALPRSDRLLAEIRGEFRDFEILPKRRSGLHRAISIGLVLVTLGGQRQYMTHYHTVLFGKLYVPDSWEAMSDEARYVLLRHERVHLQQRRRMGDFAMALAYLFFWLPFGLAWGRARIEWEAYVETIRATAEVFRPRRRASARAGDRAPLRRPGLRMDVAVSGSGPPLVSRSHRGPRGGGRVDRSGCDKALGRWRSSELISARRTPSSPAPRAAAFTSGRRSGPAPPAERRIVSSERRRSRRLRRARAACRRREEHDRERQASHRPGVGQRRDQEIARRVSRSS